MRLLESCNPGSLLPKTLEEILTGLKGKRLWENEHRECNGTVLCGMVGQVDRIELSTSEQTLYLICSYVLSDKLI
jgi:hypothetical protein